MIEEYKKDDVKLRALITAWCAQEGNSEFKLTKDSGYSVQGYMSDEAIEKGSSCSLYSRNRLLAAMEEAE
jgi:hypothetical protein